MKIIIAGASGAIGKEVDKALSARHDIVRVGFRSGDVQCDYTIPESVRDMFEKIGEFDAFISAIGGDSISNTFVKNTAPLLPRGIRINVVSPAPIVALGEDGRGLVTAADTAKFYVDAVEGDFTGRVLRAWGGLPVVKE